MSAVSCLFLGRARGFLLLVAVLGFPGLAASAPLEVRLLEPIGGVSTHRVVKVQGTVSDRTVETGSLVLNGVAQPLVIKEGAFTAYLTVAPGRNTIIALASNQGGSAMDSVTLWSRVPPRDVLVLLTWDTPHTDLDLVVTEPGGEVCKHDKRSTTAGGVLDMDDADGFGPEVYTMLDGEAGKYSVKVVYFASRGQAQTVAKVQVILYEGTAQERRHSTTVLLTEEKEAVHALDFSIVPR